MLMAWKRLSSDNCTLEHNEPYHFYKILFFLNTGNKRQKTLLSHPCTVMNGVMLWVNHIPVYVSGHKLLYSSRPQRFVCDIASLSSITNKNRTKPQLCSTGAPVSEARIVGCESTGLEVTGSGFNSLALIYKPGGIGKVNWTSWA